MSSSCVVLPSAKLKVDKNYFPVCCLDLARTEPDITCRGHSGGGGGGGGLSRQEAEYHDHSTLRLSSPSQEPSPSSQHSTPQVRRRSSGSEVSSVMLVSQIKEKIRDEKYFMQRGKPKIKQFSLLKVSKAHHETWLMSLKLGFHQIITRA